MGILRESAGQTDGLTPPLGFIRARLDGKACLIHFHSHADHNRAKQTVYLQMVHGQKLHLSSVIKTGTVTTVPCSFSESFSVQTLC